MLRRRSVLKVNPHVSYIDAMTVQAHRTRRARRRGRLSFQYGIMTVQGAKNICGLPLCASNFFAIVVYLREVEKAVDRKRG